MNLRTNPIRRDKDVTTHLRHKSIVVQSRNMTIAQIKNAATMGRCGILDNKTCGIGLKNVSMKFQ